uniref:Uncharacterized protein n=1 Tax=viral metagenome TaxID=1070528 RepID=A0A6C0F0T1_9ZZZZ
MSDEIELTVYYDSYEYDLGDGMYPSSDNKDGFDACMNIRFRREGSVWMQASGRCIDGLDGNYGEQMLARLNQLYNEKNRPKLIKENQITTKLCMSSMKRAGLTDKVLSTPLNDLTPEEFAFRVMDEMVNCEWKAQAEYIVSLIGEPAATQICTGIKNNAHEQLYPKKINYTLK